MPITLISRNLQNRLRKISLFRYMEFPDNSSFIKKVPNISSRIFNKHYYDTVLYPIFSNYTDSIFSYTYGDFDKLNDINNTYGIEEGDRILSKALRIVQDSLPAYAVISRVGGDEFCIIIPGADKSVADKYVSNIHKNLKNSNDDLYGLSITFDSTDSLQYSFDKMIEITDSNVTLAKNTRNICSSYHKNRLEVDSSQSYEWSILNTKIESAVKNFFNNFRFSSMQTCSQEQYERTTSRFMELLENLFVVYSCDHYISAAPTIHDSCSTPVDVQALLSIDSMLNSPFSILSTLSTYSPKQLMEFDMASAKVLEKLVRHSYSQLLNKQYFQNFLCPEICKSASDYQIIYFSVVGIKMSNSAYGHESTDLRLKRSSQILIKEFEKLRKFNNVSFEFRSLDNFLVDLSGGNYMALLPKDNSLSEEELMQLIHSINDFEVSDESQVSSPFHIAYAVSNSIESSNVDSFLEEIQSLKEECNKNKLPWKSKIFEVPSSNKAFINLMDPCLDYYFKYISPSSLDPKKKKLLFKNIYMSILNETFKHFKITNVSDSIFSEHDASYYSDENYLGN